jgi:putative phosphoesterase
VYPVSNVQINYTALTRIGLLSDTHHYLDEQVFGYFEPCDEIWHAGDFGTIAIAEKLRAFRPLRGVYGNIDGRDVSSVYPEKLRWKCEGVEVFMQHIGGYPGRYAPGVKKALTAHPAQLFISGHSHICKVMFDPALQCLHMNPGAAGRQGWHSIRTIIRFAIEGSNIKDCEVIELGKK